jgi:hypothetical protein
MEEIQRLEDKVRISQLQLLCWFLCLYWLGLVKSLVTTRAFCGLLRRVTPYFV